MIIVAKVIDCEAVPKVPSDKRRVFCWCHDQQSRLLRCWWCNEQRMRNEINIGCMHARVGKYMCNRTNFVCKSKKTWFIEMHTCYYYFCELVTTTISSRRFFCLWNRDGVFLFEKIYQSQGKFMVFGRGNVTLEIYRRFCVDDGFFTTQSWLVRDVFIRY